jgi:hypothetical protein
MKKISVLFVLMLTAFLVVAVSANSQNTGVDVNGDNNNVNVDATQINGATSVSQLVIFEKSSNHHLLDIGSTTGIVASFKINRPVILPINQKNQTLRGRYEPVGPNGTIQIVRSGDSRIYQYRGDASLFRVLKAGEEWTLFWEASVPVYATAMYGIDRDKIASFDGAPMSDDVYQTYDHRGITVVKGSDPMQLSRKGQITFTVEEPGWYAFVLDPRVTNSKDGIMSMMDDSRDTYEMTYEMQQTDFNDPAKIVREKVGFTSTYPTDSYGRVITT